MSPSKRTCFAFVAIAACLFVPNVDAAGRFLRQWGGLGDTAQQLSDAVSQATDSYNAAQSAIQSTTPCQNGEWMDSTGQCVASVAACAGALYYSGSSTACDAASGAAVAAVNSCGDGQWQDSTGSCISNTWQGALDNSVPAPVVDTANQWANGAGNAINDAASNVGDAGTSAYNSASNAVSDLGSSIGDAFGR